MAKMMSEEKFQAKKLSEPIRIKGLELRNRIAMAPLGTNFATEEGEVTDQLIAYYEERAKGGPGLIIGEVLCVDSPAGKAIKRQVGIHDDRLIPGLRRWVQAIQRNGTKIVAQLHHAGISTSSATTGRQPVGPSAIALPGREMPRALTTEEIKGLVSSFAAGARRAKEAGFDAIEIHCCHRYLLATFLSTLSNQRQDAYGGDLKNRARLPLEVLKAVREAVGKDYPLWCRTNVFDSDPAGGFGLSPQEAIEVAKMFQENGADAIDLSIFDTVWGSSPTTAGGIIPFAAEIKKAVSVPVMVPGRIKAEMGEAAIREGKADIIVLGRALLADPEAPNKILAGRPGDINPCINCFHCLMRIMGAQPIACTVNPSLGKEKDFGLGAAKKRKKVLVVGGGPAGMEAARIAALRGHDVTLWEKENKLGGQLIPAAMAPEKQEIHSLVAYFSGQLANTGVKAEVGKKADAEKVRNFGAEVVVLSMGSDTYIPEIPGIDRKNVVKATDVLTGKVETGKKVAIIGGELVGCETADFLTERGKKVTVLRRGKEMAMKMEIKPRSILLGRLSAKGAVMRTEVEYKRIVDQGLIIQTRDGVEQTIEADTIVIAAGSNPNKELASSLQGKVPEVYSIGDCVRPGLIYDALEDAARIGRTI